MIPAIPSCRLLAACWSSCLLSGVCGGVIGSWLGVAAKTSRACRRELVASANLPVAGDARHGSDWFPVGSVLAYLVAQDESTESDRPLDQTTEANRPVGHVRIPRWRPAHRPRADPNKPVMPTGCGPKTMNAAQDVETGKTIHNIIENGCNSTHILKSIVSGMRQLRRSRASLSPSRPSVRATDH
jgi:hypothetical protein